MFHESWKVIANDNDPLCEKMLDFVGWISLQKKIFVFICGRGFDLRDDDLIPLIRKENVVLSNVGGGKKVSDW